MPSPKTKGALGAKNSTRKNRHRGDLGDEDLAKVATPPDTDRFIHIAQAFINRDGGLAEELTRGLTDKACRCVGVWRK